MGVKQWVGKRFGRYVVIKVTDDRPPSNGYFCECRCDCGEIRRVASCNLSSGNSRSCGCLAAELSSKRRKTHGLSKSKEYRQWRGMLRRCSDPADHNFPRYGGRGIKVCDRWFKFENFVDDVGPKPSPKHSLDRIDNDGDYCPDNCRWATPHEQGSNRRNCIRLTFKGRCLTVAEWGRELGIKRNTLQSRISRGWTVEEVLSTPLRGSNK